MQKSNNRISEQLHKVLYLHFICYDLHLPTSFIFSRNLTYTKYKGKNMPELLLSGIKTISK